MNAIKKTLRGTSQARWAMWMAGALAPTTTACVGSFPKGSSPDSGTDTPGTTTLTTCLSANCPAESCTSAVYARRADLEPCYGWNPDTQTWPTATPDAIKGCDTGVDICEFDFPFEVQPGSLCAWGNEGDVVGSPSCAYEADGSDDADAFADQVNTDCALALNPVVTCVSRDLGGVTLGSTACDSCPDEGGGAAARKGRPPGTSHTLLLDPARSFLAVSTPVQSVTVRLSGDAFVDLPGGRLLGLQISADPAHVASSDWRAFSFSLDRPVALARAAEAFRIPVTERSTVLGVGRRDGEFTRVRSTATSDLTGHLSAAQKTWNLDFLDQSMLGGFALHLVGRIAP